MADERYKKLLGIEPHDEVPNYYELLDVPRGETDEKVIEAQYKQQIRKVQQVRTSKDKGFQEFLKEELRAARRILSKPKLRQEYDLSLVEDSLKGFKDFVQPLMALGTISKGVFDTMVAKGTADGLTKAQAEKVIETLAKENNATIQKEEPPPAPPPRPQAPPPQAPPPQHSGRGQRPPPQGHPPPRRPPRGEVVLGASSRPPAHAPPPHAPPPRQPPREPSAPRITRSSFYGDGGALSNKEAPPEPSGPWSRPAKESSPWRRRGSSFSRPRGGGSGGGGGGSQQQRDRWLSQQDRSQLNESIRMFNLGAKLGKIAIDVHDKLRFYFPPANGKTSRTKQINGVGYEKVFDTEQKMLRDTLKKFEGAQSKLGDLQGADAERVRSRATQNVALVKGYLDEIRQHKLKRLAGLSTAEDMRAWQDFVGSRRSARICQTVDEVPG